MDNSSTSLQSATTIIRRIQNLKKRWRDRSDFFELYGKLRSQLYETPEYQLFLVEVRSRSSGLCGNLSCFRKGRHVHHKKRVYTNPELSIDPDNGIYLCVPCHKLEHKDGTGHVKARFKKNKKIAHR